jgi:predicted porin
MMKNIWGTGSIRKSVLSVIGCAGFMLTGASFSPAFSADLGGDCCADLEERVAVLEATTARKGNRKVSLTISGLVYHQLLIWDDGVESDAYLSTNVPDAGTMIQFAGKAKINSDLSSGYVIRIHIDADNAYQQNQESDDAALGLVLTQSNMWIKSEQLGKLTIGLGHPAGDNIGIQDPTGLGSALTANFVIFDGAGFKLRTKNGSKSFVGTATWGDIAHCNQTGGGLHVDCDGSPRNVVRYDSPTIGGFVLSAAWGEDDLYDVALRYAGQLGDFKVLAGVAYTKSTDDPAGPVTESEYYQASVSAMHVPTGLFALVAYGQEEGKVDPTKTVNVSLPDRDQLYIKAGIRQKWNQLGATILYGEYGISEDGFNATTDLFGAGVVVTGSEFDQYGLGIVQEIDAASLAIFAKWKHYEGDVSTTAGNVEFEEIDFFGVGGVISF